MTREFPDELLSAFLDNELTPAERDQVEQHLAASEADRQLLTELKALRRDVQTLPQAAISPDFADRVVRAAVAEAERHRSADTTVSLPARTGRQWMVWAAVASAAALAACFLLVVQPWRSPGDSQLVGPVTVDPGQLITDSGKLITDSGKLIADSGKLISDSGKLIADSGKVVEQVAVASTDFLQTLRSALTPEPGEAVVLRIRVPKDVPLSEAIDAALTKAGIDALGTEIPSRALRWQDAYLKHLEAQQPDSGSLAAASAAVFIEAPLASIEQVFTDLASAVKQPWQLNPDGKLALDARGARSVGESADRKPFAQRLNAALFKLNKTASPTAASPTTAVLASTPTADQLVRVLLFVETD